MHLWGITLVFPSLSLLDDPRSTVICIAGNTSHNLSFEKDITAGVFTSLDNANSIESCVRRACNRRGGDMIFLVGENCFMVRCYSTTSCKIVKPSSPSSIDIFITPYTWFGKLQLTEFSCLAKFLSPSGYYTCLVFVTSLRQLSTTSLTDKKVEIIHLTDSNDHGGSPRFSLVHHDHSVYHCILYHLSACFAEVSLFVEPNKKMAHNNCLAF